MECAYYLDFCVDGTWNVPTTLTFVWTAHGMCLLLCLLSVVLLIDRTRDVTE
jgi:hypothetical protein